MDEIDIPPDSEFAPAPPDLVELPSEITVFIPVPLTLDNFLRNGSPYLTPDWTEVLREVALTVVTDPAATVTLAFDTRYWKSIFSSSVNATKFGSSSVAAQVANPSTAVVVGMKPPTALPLTGPIKFSAIRDEFGIDATNTPSALINLLNAVDATGALTLNLDTSPTARNAIFIFPEDAYKITVNMVFRLSNQAAIEAIQQYVKDQLGLTVSILLTNCSFEFQRTDLLIPNPATPESDFDRTLSYRFTISMQTADFAMSAVFTPDGMDFYLSDPPAGPGAGSILDRLNRAVTSAAGGSTVAAGSLPAPGSTGPFNTLLRDVHLWYINLNRDVISTEEDASGEITPVFGDFYWKITLLGVWVVGATPQTILVAFEYDSRSSIFTGRLVFHQDLPDDMAHRQPGYFAVTDALPPSVTVVPASSLRIWDLFTDKGHPPKNIPSEFTAAFVSFKKFSGDGYGMNFGTTIKSNTAVTGSAAGAPSILSWDDIGVQVAFRDAGATTSTDVQVSTVISLRPAAGVTGPEIAPAVLSIVGEYYTGGAWLVHGRLEDVSVRLIAAMFKQNVTNSGILGSLALKSLDITYTFSDTGDASSFLVTGALVIAGLELDLTYQYASELLGDSDDPAAEILWAGEDRGPDAPTVMKPTGSGAARAAVWAFEARLGARSPGSTLGSVIDSFVPNTSSSLPAFIRTIDIPQASGDSAPILFRLFEIDSGSSSGPADRLLLTLRVSFPHLVLTFLSLSYGTTVKRLLRVSADQIPLLSSIPIIEVIPQPFDQLIYLWLDDASNTGLTREELNWINLALDKTTPQVQVKETNNPNVLSAPVLLPNHHFMIVQGGEVILDHVFGQANDDEETDPTTGGPKPVADPTKGDIEKQLPFLDIHAITLQFKAPVLRVGINATVALGPVQLTVIDFHIDLDLGKIKLNSLADLAVPNLHLFSAGITGLAISLDIPPIKIAGLFLYSKTTTEESFSGGVALSFQAWQFMAVGEYKKLARFKSVFIYAKLDGPLLTLGFATVSGVRVGFGYNSTVRSPTLLELPAFPFLDGSGEAGGASDPMAVMVNMMGGTGAPAWISAKEDSYWVVAGLKLTAFGILSVTAVAMLGFRAEGVIISIFAQGCAQMPPAFPPDACLFYVELDMLAELNTVEGYFTVQAALAPASHVLLASCRLMGGFALVNWFDPSTHSGDFVFTVGGYHRAFQPPPYYPVVPRIGVSFTLAEIINVSGVVYFAITPKCVMGGGAVHFGLEVGPVSAWLDVSFDVFVQFNPFHYTADLAVSVGCAMSIKVWFIHVTIKISVGAQLHIEGPDPFCGYATVEFYLFAFTIHFGDSKPPPAPINAWDFYEMVKTPGPVSSDANSTVTDKRRAQHKYTVKSGLLPPDIAPAAPAQPFPSSGATTPWRVLAGTFACSIGFDFAISTAELFTSDDGAGTKTSVPILPSDGSPIEPFYSKPMHIQDPIRSSVEVRVVRITDKATVVDAFNATLETKDVPVALWGQYNASEDPATPGREPTQKLSDPRDPTMRLCMAIDLTPKAPTMVASSVQTFQPAVAFRVKLGPSVMDAQEPRQDTLLPSTEVRPTEEGVPRWTHVSEDWAGFAGDGQHLLENPVREEGQVQGDGILRAAAQVLGWSTPPPSAGVSVPDGTRAPWMLKAAAPTRLIGEMKTRWPVLPRYTVVSA